MLKKGKRKSRSANDYISPTVLPRPLPASDIRRDHLHFIKELGSGQYGSVWLAETKLITDKGVATKVAVKTNKGECCGFLKLRLVRMRYKWYADCRWLHFTKTFILTPHHSKASIMSVLFYSFQQVTTEMSIYVFTFLYRNLVLSFGTCEIVLLI